MQSLYSLNKYLYRYKSKLVLGFVFVLLTNIFALFPAQLIGKSFDLIATQINAINLNGGQDYQELYSSLSIYAGLLILVALVRGVFMFFMRQNIIVMSRYVEYDLKNDIYAHYQNLSSLFYRTNDSGDLLNRITEDVSKVRMYLGPAIMYSVNLIFLILLIVSRMFTISFELTIIVLLPLPLLSFLIYQVSHSINIESNNVQKKLSALTNIVQQTFSGIRLVKAFSRESDVLIDFNKLSSSYMYNHIALSKINSIFFPLVLLLVGFSVTLTIYVGGLLVVQNLVTIGEVSEFIIYVNMLTWPVTSVGWVTEVIQRAEASQRRINNFLNIKSYTQFYNHNSKNHDLAIINSISLNNLSYKYVDVLALNSVTLDIKSNQTIGLVGSVGSGKTTMLNILCGILEPSSGQLLFNRTDSFKFNWERFRTHIAYVSQEVFLFSDSIKNNIMLGADSTSFIDLNSILEKLCLLEEINAFSQGLNTEIGEGGVTLSGGQKQRIALARALVRKPKFLFLDDALSNVDSTTELKILNFLNKELKHITIILTSNRLSVLKHCDTIFVLKEGALVQVGKSKELLNKDGEYRSLFGHQILLES